MTKMGASLLALHALGVLRSKNRDICRPSASSKVSTRQMPSNGSYFPVSSIVLVLDVHAGDVVGQQHDFVAEELVGVLVRQLLLGISRMTRTMKLPVPTNGSRMHAVGCSRRLAKLLLAECLHRSDHEVHDGLRRIDDAVGVGHLDAEALEELLVDGVQEALLLGEVVDGGGGGLDGAVEAVERLQEFGRLKLRW